MRGRIDLEGEEYTGRPTSRADWAGERVGLAAARRGTAAAPAGADDADEEDEDEDEDEDEEDDMFDDDDEDGEGHAGVSDEDEDGSDDDDDDDEEEEEEEEARPRARRRRAPASDDDGGDAEAAALDAELAAVAAAEAAAVEGLRARAASERAKARAVGAQRALWERALEMRIKLQRALAGAARLPSAAAHAALPAAAPDAAAALAALAATAAATAAELNELRTALCARQPGLATVVPAAVTKGLSPTDALWARLEAGRASFVPFRDASFDRWHAKASLAGGGAAARPGLTALNQPPSQQVRIARFRWSFFLSVLPPLPLCTRYPLAGDKAQRPAPPGARAISRSEVNARATVTRCAGKTERERVGGVLHSPPFFPLCALRRGGHNDARRRAKTTHTPAAAPPARGGMAAPPHAISCHSVARPKRTHVLLRLC
jgi:hypothetical protein